MEVIQQQATRIGNGCQGCQLRRQESIEEKAALIMSVSVTSCVSFLLAESQRLAGVLRNIESTLGELRETEQIEGEDEKPSLSSKTSAAQQADKRSQSSKDAPQSTQINENAPVISQDSNVDAEINELARSLISLLEAEKQKDSQVRKRDHDIPFPLF